MYQTSSLVYSLGPQAKEIPHLTLDTSKKTFESVPPQRFLPLTRQILKSSMIKASKYKVENTTEVIKKYSRL